MFLYFIHGHNKSVQIWIELLSCIAVFSCLVWIACPVLTTFRFILGHIHIIAGENRPSVASYGQRSLVTEQRMHVPLPHPRPAYTPVK